MPFHYQKILILRSVHRRRLASPSGIYLQCHHGIQNRGSTNGSILTYMKYRQTDNKRDHFLWPLDEGGEWLGVTLLHNLWCRILINKHQNWWNVRWTFESKDWSDVEKGGKNIFVLWSLLLQWGNRANRSLCVEWEADKLFHVSSISGVYISIC